MASQELQKKVVELYVVERPLNSSSGQSGAKMALTHEGCVAVTKDGQHYLIEKGVAPDGRSELHRIGSDKGSRVVNIGMRMPADFKTVKKAEVTKVCNLEELLEASGRDYHWFLANCWDSTVEMQKVVNDELHLPWLVNAGVGVGVVGVIAMLLFAINKMIIKEKSTA